MKKSNVSFILVEPREGGNVGAAARAIKNMGFTRLELVAPCDFTTTEATAFAHGAQDVLDSAKVYGSFDEAVGGKSLVVGISRRAGKTRGLIPSLAEAAAKIALYAEENDTAIVFGREDKGLYNTEVSRCGFLASIPTSEAHPSLNLAQAVLLVAYELSRQGADETRRGAGHGGTLGGLPDAHKIPPLVTQAQLESLYERANKLLETLGYGPRGSNDLPGGIMRNMRHFVGRAGLTRWEFSMLHGICTSIEKKVRMKDNVTETDTSD
jgi:TrmH family RNA methyltransferase